MSEEKQEKQENLGKRWYVIHTYSGYENKVKLNLEGKKQSLGMEDQIFRIEIPVDKETEVKDGKKRIVERKVFPGYVLIEMIVDDKSWYAVRNTPGVTGFVGSGTKPIPLTEAEVHQILGIEEEKEVKPSRPIIDYQLNEVVRFKDGPFGNQTGKISEINQEKGKLTILVDFMGRETPTVVDYTQVEKVE